MSEEAFLAGLASRSYVARLDRDARQAVIREISDLLGDPDAPIEGDHVVVPMRTDVYWTRLPPG